MSGQDWFIFALTFITGVATGVYVYVVSFKPTYAPEDIAVSEIAADDFSIIGKQYGGRHERGYIAPSFRLAGNGTYGYIAGGVSDEALTPVEGNVPRALMNTLTTLATHEQLELLAEGRDGTVCRSYSDGIDYRYRFILEGIEYELDSCETALGYETELALALEDFWTALSTGDFAESDTVSGSLPIPIGDSFYDTGVNFIRENLSPYEN